MFDYYALPNSFPGMDRIHSINGSLARVRFLQQELGGDINAPRFIPFLLLHEFEALLFSDIQILDSPALFRTSSQAKQLQQILTECGSPEAINNGYDTAPSRRISRLFPSFDKVLHGIQIAERIGIGLMRQVCPHFDEWVSKLEALQPLPGC